MTDRSRAGVHPFRGGRTTAWLLTAWLVVMTGATARGDVNILTLGDSITEGYGSNDGSGNNIGGYRYYLDLLLDSNFHFIGNRSFGYTTGPYAFDADTWAQGGGTAQHDRPGNTPSMLRAVHNITANPTSHLAAFNPTGGKVDAVLIHAGTNNSLRTNAERNAAWDQMYALLHGGNVNGAGDYASILNATGLDAQLAKPAVANPDAHVFVAGIVPNMFTGFAQQEQIDRWMGSGIVNSWYKNDLLPTLAGSATTYHYVDLFSIRIDDLNLPWLAGLFTGGNVSTLVGLLSPDNDALYAGTDYDYVDWGIGFNEHLWDEGAMGSLPPGFSFGGVNFNLYADLLHPTNLGYAVMANVWYNALLSVYATPPPPTEAHWISAASGNWDTAGNWLDAVLPAAGLDVYINPASPASLTVTGPAAAVSIDSLEIGHGTGSATLALAAGTITATGDVHVGSSGRILVNTGTKEIGTGATTGLAFAGSFTNHGTLEAASGATLRLRSATFTNTGGIISAQNGSIVELREAIIVGGTLTTAGTGIIRGVSGGTNLSTLQSLTNSGAYEVGAASRTLLAGTITNNGTMHVEADNTRLYVADGATVTLAGTGTLRLGDANATGNAIEAQGAGGGATTLVNSAGHTLAGDGALGKGEFNITNHGSIIADVAGRTLAIHPSATFNSDGVVRATSGGTIQFLGGTVSNTGTVEALNGSSILYDAAATTSNNNAGVLTGGTWRVTSTGDATTLQVSGSPITRIATGTIVELSGADAALRADATPIEESLTHITGTLKLAAGRTFNAAGDLLNDGAVELRLGSSTATTMNITGSYTQDTAGSLALDIAGFNPGQFGAITATGAVNLAGSLNVTILGELLTTPGDFIAILTGQQILGTFDSTLIPAGYDLVYQPTFLAIQAHVDILLGDANNDGVVNAADLLAVERHIGAVGITNGTLLGDANDDGRVDGDDFLAVERNFGAVFDGGLPTPEPATAGLLLLSLAASLPRTARRR